MIRTQIQLTEEQDRKLRQMAREEGISMAEAVRRCLDRVLQERSGDRQKRYERAADLVGRFADREGADDVARRHDRYLDEEYE